MLVGRVVECGGDDFAGHGACQVGDFFRAFAARTSMRWHSGWFLAMPCARACSTEVLPAFGGATIKARCPLPTGMSRSVTRVVRAWGSVSSRIRSFG